MPAWVRLKNTLKKQHFLFIKHTLNAFAKNANTISSKPNCLSISCLCLFVCLFIHSLWWMYEHTHTHGNRTLSFKNHSSFFFFASSLKTLSLVAWNESQNWQFLFLLAFFLLETREKKEKKRNITQCKSNRNAIIIKA